MEDRKEIFINDSLDKLLKSIRKEEIVTEKDVKAVL